MKTFVRVEDGEVAEIFKADKLPEFHPDLDWRDATAISGISEGWIVTGNSSFAPAAPPSATQVKASTNADIQAQIDALEKGQHRAIREATIGTLGAIDRLKALDAKIAALRAQFVK